MKHDKGTNKKLDLITHLDMIIWMAFIGCLNEKECPEVKQIDYKLMPNAYWTNEAKNDISELWEFHKKQQTPYHGYVDVALIFRTIKQRGEKALSITLEKKEEGPFKWLVMRTNFYVEGRLAKNSLIIEGIHHDLGKPKK